MTPATAGQTFEDRNLSLDLARVAERTALAAANWIGRGDEMAADQAAVDAMHRQLAAMDMDGVVVIGEGVRDESSKLHIGEAVGTGSGPVVDVALDPLEGATLAAKDMAGAMTVIAVGPRGSLLHAPDVYMDKVAIGPGYAEGLVTLEMSPAERITALAEARGCDPAAITVCILERPRHQRLIAEVRETGAAIRLISDGDVAGVMHCAEPGRTGIDIYMGIGGAPEGVLAAAALKCTGGQFEGRLVLRNDDERARARRAGVTEPDRLYRRDDLAAGDVIFAATGVTDGSLLPGVRRNGKLAEATSLVMRSSTGSVRRITYRAAVED